MIQHTSSIISLSSRLPRWRFFRLLFRLYVAERPAGGATHARRRMHLSLLHVLRVGFPSSGYIYICRWCRFAQMVFSYVRV
jgi:hypothetical protein